MLLVKCLFYQVKNTIITYLLSILYISLFTVEQKLFLTTGQNSSRRLAGEGGRTIDFFPCTSGHIFFFIEYIVN